jgi:hypothetical protein
MAGLASPGCPLGDRAGPPAPGRAFPMLILEAVHWGRGKRPPSAHPCGGHGCTSYSTWLATTGVSPAWA